MVGRVLRQAREAAGVSQQDAAARADMDRAYVSEVENGKRSISLDRFLRLCAGLNVRAGDAVAEIERQLPGKRPSSAGRPRAKS